ncbi:uncharacterized protein LOC104058678 [Cuculus canorus]|uniref:uncharacterized protein LOC104058678 n=1 Tax=Cuculus canorus TaxID=55661 RepID=UPI0023AA8305|nr:uncharacterized protein LOC104058678 [Cuculus canorus]
MELLRVLLALAGLGTAAGLALLPYVPRLPPAALPGKLTATTFALERPCCVFNRHANASDAVWLVVAFANASSTFRNPVSPASVPRYAQLPTAYSYMTLKTAAAAYTCSSPSPDVLRVGSDTACRDQDGQDPCNGPLPSPGPYRVKFLVMDCHGPKAETKWSDPILLRRGTGSAAIPHRLGASTPKPRGEKWSVTSPRCPPTPIASSLLLCDPHIPHPPLAPASSPSDIDPMPLRCGSTVVIIASILASLGAALAVVTLSTVGYGRLGEGAGAWRGASSKEMGLTFKKLFFYLKSRAWEGGRAPLIVGRGCQCQCDGFACLPHSAEAWGALCRRDPGSSAFARSSYRTHHIPPTLPSPQRPVGPLCSLCPQGGALCPSAWRMRPGKRARPVCREPGRAQECGRLVVFPLGRSTQHPQSRPRHPGTRTMLPLLLLLLANAHAQEPLPYTPVLASPTLGGLITTSTFVLEQPRCVFDAYSDAVIWLVVAIPSAVPNFNDSLEPGTPERSFQGFPTTAPAYLTLNTTLLNYPCQKPSGEITVLRVGSETSCTTDETRPTCNGPLPGPGPYRVKFLALEGSVPVAETAWSKPITLQTAQPPSSIGAERSQHSAGMVALTAILSILFAILLATLVAVLLFEGRDACGGSSTFSKPEAVTVQRYNTHHVYDQPAARL